MFRTLFQRFFKKSSPPSAEASKPEHYAAPIAANLLTRYLPSKSRYSIDKMLVKPAAFLPPPDLQLSCFRVDDLEQATIWSLADNNNVVTSSGRPVEARADFNMLAVDEIARESQLPLRADLDDVPPRHVSIVGWPADKDAQMIGAQGLSRRASLKLRTQVQPA